MDSKQLRIENYEKRRSVLLSQGYEEHCGTISIIKANVMAMMIAGPIAILAFIIYFNTWESISFDGGIQDFLLFYLVILLSVPIHEGIHGLTWLLFCKEGRKSIHFGIMWKYLTPYCHCSEPLVFSSYIIGGLMPFFMLGIASFLISLMVKSPLLLAISMLNILAAGGDLTIAFMLFPHRKAKILDHPTECGFLAYTKEKIEK